MLKLVGTARSRAMRVLWTLEELGLDYEYAPALPRTPEALAAHPEGKVPALITDEGVLTESVAIMQYLADLNGKLTQPAGTFARARQDEIVSYANDQLDGILWTIGRHSFVLPEEKRVDAVRGVSRWEAARSFENLASRLEGRAFAAGEMFTIADILIGHCARWARTAKVELPESGPVADYLSKILSRPALQAAIARAASATKE